VNLETDAMQRSHARARRERRHPQVLRRRLAARSGRDRRKKGANKRVGPGVNAITTKRLKLSPSPHPGSTYLAARLRHR